jgi:ATP-dependent DNA ligase
MKAAKGDGWERYIGHPDFIMEEKFDGGRYIVVITVDGIKVLSRRLIDKTANVPQLVTEVEQMIRHTPSLARGTILDGEITADTSFSNTISLVNSLPSRGMMNSIPYHYWVFDLIASDGVWLNKAPFYERRELLENAIGEGGDHLALTPQEPVGRAGLEAIWARGGEGVIVKDTRAHYFPGKRPPRVWMKVKAVQTAEGVIIDFTKGEGKFSDTIGAAIIGQVKGGRLQAVTKISGFTDELRYELGRNQKRYVGQVVEFKFQLKTADSYRHPRFLRFRPDKRATDCRWIDS